MPLKEHLSERISRADESDEVLVSRYIESEDDRAFQMLVERHQERIFGFIYGMVRDRDVANDLFQETFVRIISALQKQRGSYSHQGRWLGWALRIARNATLDYLRTRKRWQDVSSNGESDDDNNSFWERLPDAGPIADTSLHRAEQSEYLRACIDRLADDQREVLLLRHEAELTFREIADLTDCSINTALGRMRYALLNLRREMNASPRTDLTEVE
jgi:RNA polymerase sigma-70 factor (ECF subfamily)